jgi:hypothetical protein
MHCLINRQGCQGGFTKVPESLMAENLLLKQLVDTGVETLLK